MTFLYSSNLVKRILSEWALNLYICFPTFLLSYFLCGGKKKVNKTSSYEEFGIKKQNKTLIWSRICKNSAQFPILIYGDHSHYKSHSTNIYSANPIYQR